MLIDIFFLTMVFFGFYFGFTFGLIKVAVYVVALLLALAAAMRLTPTTESLIRETFEIESVYLPFFAFVLTLLTVLGIARMLTKLLEGTINSGKFNTISRVFGGIIMSLTFLFLYSVLITFFAEAKVISENEKGEVPNSFSYKYIQMIPEKGHVVLETVAPFVGNFMVYMRNALKAIERRNSNKTSTINLDDYNHIKKTPAMLLDSLERADSIKNSIRIAPSDSAIVYPSDNEKIPTINIKKQ